MDKVAWFPIGSETADEDDDGYQECYFCKSDEEEELVRCSNTCGVVACRGCLRSCGACGRSFCKLCREKCDFCDKRICARCSPRCVKCKERHCRACIDDTPKGMVCHMCFPEVWAHYNAIMWCLKEVQAHGGGPWTDFAIKL